MLLITRPAPEGENLSRQLNNKGYKTLWMPTLAFAPPNHPTDCEKMLQALDHYHWLIFISREAVRQALPYLPTTLPASCRVAAIGKATAQLLTEQGYVVSACPAQAASADTLLSLPAFQSLAGQRIALLKGQGGRKEPARTLSARGGDVSEIILYQRICPVPDNLHTCQEAILQHQLRAILITSAEGLLNLLRLTGPACRTILQKTPLIVISLRLQRLAIRLGFIDILLRDNAGEDAMINALQIISGKKT